MSYFSFKISIVLRGGVLTLSGQLSGFSWTGHVRIIHTQTKKEHRQLPGDPSMYLPTHRLPGASGPVMPWIKFHLVLNYVSVELCSVRSVYTLYKTLGFFLSTFCTRDSAMLRGRF